MARPADPQRFDALNQIRKYMLEHGEQEGARLAKLDGYRHINKATWSQWCKLVREEDRQLAVDVILNVPHPGVPAGQAPPFTPIAPVTDEQRTVVLQSIDFFKMLGSLIADANLLAEYAAPIDAGGFRKIRNPVMLVQAHRAKAMNMQLAMKHAEAAWNAQMAKDFEKYLYEMLIDALKGEDLEIARRIAKKLDTAVGERKMQIAHVAPASIELYAEQDRDTV